jgi:hypothetical protein
MGGYLVLGLVVGGLVGAGVGAFVEGIVIAPESCACPAILVLDLSIQATGVSRAPSGDLYGFEVTGVRNGQPTYGDVDFAFTNASGSGVLPSGTWTLGLSGDGVNVTAHFDPAHLSWSGVGALGILTGERWTFDAQNTTLDGGTLQVIGTGAEFAGSVAVGIP